MRSLVFVFLVIGSLAMLYAWTTSTFFNRNPFDVELQPVAVPLTEKEVGELVRIERMRTEVYMDASIRGALEAGEVSADEFVSDELATPEVLGEWMVTRVDQAITRADVEAFFDVGDSGVRDLFLLSGRDTIGEWLEEDVLLTETDSWRMLTPEDARHQFTRTLLMDAKAWEANMLFVKAENDAEAARQIDRRARFAREKNTLFRELLSKDPLIGGELTYALDLTCAKHGAQPKD